MLISMKLQTNSNSHEPRRSGQIWTSIGKLTRFIGQAALIVNLKIYRVSQNFVNKLSFFELTDWSKEHVRFDTISPEILLINFNTKITENSTHKFIWCRNGMQITCFTIEEICVRFPDFIKHWNAKCECWNIIWWIFKSKSSVNPALSVPTEGNECVKNEN